MPRRCNLSHGNRYVYRAAHQIGVTISNPVFTEDAINKRKQERELLNKICIVSMLARLRLMPKGCAQ
ncbi:cell division inhibition protein DicB [Escherichia coli]|nr:cell division inhibition protein DicB [Escherichia coli]MBI0818678.1 cell division inhibition protein DicB [Escherichia coli]HDD8841510.1 cell division inhibition protein DicB [Escherichia coli]